MLGEVGLERSRQIKVREPEPRSSVGGEDPCRRGGREHQLLTHVDGAERLVAVAQLDDPVAVVIAAGRRSGEPELELDSVGAHRRYGSRKCGRRIDDEEVARREEPRQLTKATVHDGARTPRGDEQADTVARNAAFLRRLVRLEASGQRDNAHAAAPTRSRAR